LTVELGFGDGAEFEIKVGFRFLAGYCESADFNNLLDLTWLFNDPLLVKQFY
jgi:hypothetical protein